MTRGATVLFAAMTAFFFVFPNLGLEQLADFDEAWHALVAIDIARTGNFLSYTEEGHLTTASVKPPLYFWAMALCFKFIGTHEFAARLFPALCYVAMVACVAWFCCAQLHWSVALVAAFLLSTQSQMLYHHCARTADIDAPLILFLTLVMFGTFLMRGGRTPPWMPLAWCAALLTKGLASVQILPVLALWLVIERQWRLAGRIGLALALGTLPALAFFVIREQAQPGVFAALLGREFVGRLSSEVDDPHMNGTFFYVQKLFPSTIPVLAGVLLTLIAVRFRPRLALQREAGGRAGPLLRFLVLWAIVPIVLFSLAGTKRVWYVYPSLVPAYILAAWVLRAGLHRLEASGRNRVGPLVALIVLGGLGLPAFAASFSPRRSDYARNAEAVQYAAFVRAQSADATVIAYWASPSDRFVLRREEVGYQVIRDAAALRAAVQASTRDLLLVFRETEAGDVNPLLERSTYSLRAAFPVRGTLVVRIQRRDGQE